MAGPFAGLAYEGINAFGSLLTPKLLGTYELELQQTMDEILNTKPSFIIDIGAAEGYYAVGIASKMGDQAEVVAFESNPAAQRELTRLAENNGVADRITCLGECTVSELGNVLRPDCLVICDCEGAELTLLDPQALPALRSAAVLVELHHGVVDDIAELFRTRFSASHSIKQIHARKRYPSDCTILAGLRRRDVDVALNEHRKFGLQWMWMKPLGSEVWANDGNVAISRDEP